MRTPDGVIRSAAVAFLAVVAEHPADVRHGQAQIVDLAAVLDGHQAPSIARKATARRGRVHTAPQMSFTDAASNVMSYTDATEGSHVHHALNQFRDAVLKWTPSGPTTTAGRSAPSPRHRST